MPIDYSKWDNIDDASSSSSSEDEGPARVTRLDGPSKVSFGGGGGGADPSVSITTTPDGRSGAEKISPAPASNRASASDTWTHQGGLEKTPDGRELRWTQDRYTVTFRLELRDDEDPKRLQVSVVGMLPYADRFHAVGTHNQKIDVRYGSEKLLYGELPFSVHFAQDEEGQLDWTVERNAKNVKYLTIPMHKAVPMQGVFLWWQFPIVGYPGMDTEVYSKLGGSDGSSSTSPQFVQAWEEAHRQFKEKIKAKR